MIRGDDFFEHTLRALERQGARFEWERRAVEVRGASIETDRDSRTFDAVIDAAFEATRAPSILWQSFAGVWITTEADFFDSSTATLMDLHASSAEAPVGFMYILPTSPRRALVEHTTFSPSPLSEDSHIERCVEWIMDYTPSGTQLGEREYGVIPMGLKERSHTGHCVVGSASGAVRPATGYAFVSVQRQAQEMARRVLAGNISTTANYPRWVEVADTLFLTALRNAPEHGAEIMSGLLSSAPADRLISFLAGTASFRDALSVWLSVPKRIMLRSLVRL